MVLALAALNAYLHWRILTGRSLTWHIVLSASAADLVLITLGILITNGFRNTFFVLYYPGLLGLSLVAFSWHLRFAVAIAVAAVYTAMSFVLPNGPVVEMAEEKVLAVRLASMFAVVATVNLMIGVERKRRREAVAAERAQAKRNLELQHKAQEAELAAQEERGRIAREIHDGIAQSIYALSLNLETCADLAERDDRSVGEQIRRLVPLSKQTLLEIRYYIYDQKPLLAGEKDLEVIAENQVKEFRIVAGAKVNLSTEGQPREVSLAVASGLYRILQEPLGNVLKHSRASEVDVALTYEPDRVRVSVTDNGVGVDTDNLRTGFGLENIRHRAEELRGSFEISGALGAGTRVGVALPVAGGTA